MGKEKLKLVENYNTAFTAMLNLLLAERPIISLDERDGGYVFSTRTKDQNEIDLANSTYRFLALAVTSRKLKMRNTCALLFSCVELQDRRETLIKHKKR